MTYKNNNKEKDEKEKNVFLLSRFTHEANGI